MTGSSLGLAVLGVAIAAVAGAVVGRRVAIPYPTFLVVIGIGLGFIHVVPDLRLHPDVVFLVFLPPLVFAAGLFGAPRELAAQKLPIGLLAIGLVLVSAAATAAVGMAVLGLPLGAAVVLGAAVSPTDPVAATTVLERADVPAELPVILEGEGVMNDGVALVLFAIAVEGATASHVSVTHVLREIFVGVPAGVVIGFVAAYLVDRAVRLVTDPPVEIAISLIAPYLAYLPADRIGASGVLAALTAGLYLGWRLPNMALPRVRLEGRALWEVLVLVLNVALFVLLGLSFPAIAETAPRGRAHLVAGTAAVVATVLVLRMAWMFVVPWLLGLFGREGERSWRDRVVLGWCGVRGAVSLAAALAVPAGVGRDGDTAVIVFATCGVIIATLVLQAATLPLVLRALGLTDTGDEGNPNRDARLCLVDEALDHLRHRAEDGTLDDEVAGRVRDMLRARRSAVAGGDAPEGLNAEDANAYYDIRLELLHVQREALLRLRDCGAITSETFRVLQRDLDLEETLLG